MPKDSKLDRCHTHVQTSLEKNGMDPKKADGTAWGICKRNIHDDETKINKAISAGHKELDQIEKDHKLK